MKPQELAEFFQESLCIFDLKSTDKRGAMSEMVGCISENLEFKDQDLLLDMLMNRESLGSTAIGKGVAFPHGRSLAIQELSVLFARSVNGVDFDALDKKPTHLFFLIIAPPQDKDNLYLQVLGHLVELIKSAPLRKRLMEVTSFTELQETLGSA
ncbi:MAG: PTS sugar transporter subunit IIA [Candidatus Latescibacterota bacterium]|nr:MAG: PTS sugar transporter subunit IIA [Candidatus Latescibacterota bacterium]